jgi:hypothetical protein
MSKKYFNLLIMQADYKFQHLLVFLLKENKSNKIDVDILM